MPRYSAWSYPPPPARPTRETGLGVAALVVGLCFAPRSRNSDRRACPKETASDVDRICVWIGLGISGFSMLVSGCMAS